MLLGVIMLWMEDIRLNGLSVQGLRTAEGQSSGAAPPPPHIIYACNLQPFACSDHSG